MIGYGADSRTCGLTRKDDDDGLEVVDAAFKKRFSASAPAPAAAAASWRAGARVQLRRRHQTATVRFYGETEFADGLWVGLELDHRVGNHDGVVQGHRYYKCEAGHGVFMRPGQLSLLSTGLDSSDVDRLLSRNDDLNTSSTLLLDEEEDLQPLYVFGENLSGQLGLAHQRSNVLLPAISNMRIPEGYSLVDISCGHKQSLALLHTAVDTNAAATADASADRTALPSDASAERTALLVCGSCALGAGIPFSARDELSFIQPAWAEPHNFALATASDTLCAALTTEQRLLLWGDDLDGVVEVELWPALGSVDLVVSLSCGGSHIFLCCRSGSLFHTRVHRSVVDDVRLLYTQPSLHQPHFVDCQTRADGFALALDQSGRIWEIKSRIRGETPVTLLEEFSSRVVKIACGDHHSMALSENGDVFCWGSGRYGQLGLGTFEDHQRPQRVEAFDRMEGRIVEIACGAHHSICLMDSNRVCTWGSGDQGQLGHGSLASFCLPHPVLALEGKKLSHIRAGGNISMLFSTLTTTTTTKASAQVSMLSELEDLTPTSILPYEKCRRPSFDDDDEDDDTDADDEATSVPSPLNSALEFDDDDVTIRYYQWRNYAVECEEITSPRVFLTHRCLNFEVDVNTQYRGALNLYIKGLYASALDSYVLNHISTSKSKSDAIPQSPSQQHRSRNASLMSTSISSISSSSGKVSDVSMRACSLLLLCRPNTNAVAHEESEAPPFWIHSFLDAFHPLQLQPQFLQLSPPSSDNYTEP